MTIEQIIRIYSQQLKITSSSPILDIELLLTKALNKPKEYLYKYPKKNLKASQLNKFKKLFNRRLKGEPIAYILGHKEFYGLDFKVNKNALIPRPETEFLVEAVINLYKTKTPKLYNSKTLIIDIGTGSGAIIIALAKNIPKAEFIATDISPRALNIAKQNAKKHKIKIKFLKGNLLDPILQFPNYQLLITNSLIVANLPYLDKKEENLLPSSNTIGLKFEPKIAYDGGPDGLKYFRQLFAQIQKYNLKPKAIFLEIGHKQADKIKKIARLSLPKYKFQVKKDLCGFDRVLILTK
ncbi:MAG: protein-(glutamine-N5) methyltransferase, release factor-specific [Candidatus Buchananbacteria bacterium RBG_13_36_9]|uniref:Protein-(Glutamine-N5) methyltransferase, release factor-specific n=1 Tax=Candidatus Buchananbacteria bacterium RBG_13_36_9 TaxID=1797530 RepID=A0A1G1XQ37_9BACT|nr:MAG: protein-(glutamine-N5) methyltransferase, release factor-specific [Candidatus Buchananbacteria bacterium RBG_13_36_9]